MPTYNTVKPEDLIAHCMRFLNEGWGYIYGAFGQIWTQAQQDAKSKTDEQIRKYGQQWVGKHVIDCSGVWYLAMQELGSYMYHGSNTMWDKFTVSKGRLSKGKRTDGKELKPGTAIFTGINDGDHNHVGIYIGDGKVLEAGGVQKGVITLRKGSTGEYVTLLQTKLIQRGYDLAPYGADGKYGDKTATAVRMFQKDNGLVQDGVTGANTWNAILSGQTTLYTVTVQHLSKSVAEDIVGKYGGTMKAEG